jgi:hypothetical protein
MYDSFVKYVVEKHLGDVASVVAVIVTVVGFFITIRNTMKSKTAAEKAKSAVVEMRKDLAKTNTIADISSAITAMEEIKRLHRKEEWELLPERYSSLRKLLICVKGAAAIITEERKSVIQGAIVNFSSMEKQMEKIVAEKAMPKNRARLNETVSSEMDNLQAMLVEIQNEIGR